MTYPRSCTAYCKESAERGFCTAAESTLASVVKDIALAGVIADADALLAVSTHGNRGAPTLRWLHICAAGDRSGHHEPWATMAELQPEVPHGELPENCTGISLNFCRGPFVKPCRRPRAPLDQQQHGPLLLFSGDELAAQAACSLEPGAVVEKILFRNVPGQQAQGSDHQRLRP